MPQTQGDRIAAGTSTEPGLFTDPETVPKELRNPSTSPSTHVAGNLGAKYGDVKTAKVGGVVDALSAALRHVSDKHTHIKVQSYKHGTESYKHGTDYVPHTGPAILHEGEKVIPADQNQDSEWHYYDPKTGEEVHQDMNHTKEEKNHFHRAMSHLNKGSLHRHLGIAEDQPIPLEKKQEAANSENPHIAAQGRLALAMHGWNHGK